MSCWCNIHLCICFSDRTKNGVSSHFYYLPYEGWRGGRETGRKGLGERRKGWEKWEKGREKGEKGDKRRIWESKNKNDLKWQKGNEILSVNWKMNKACFLLFIHREIYFSGGRKEKTIPCPPLLYIYNRWTNWQWYWKLEYTEKTIDLPQLTEQHYHIMLYRVHLVISGIRIKNVVVIDTDCIGSCQSNYHTIKT